MNLATDNRGRWIPVRVILISPNTNQSNQGAASDPSPSLCFCSLPFHKFVQLTSINQGQRQGTVSESSTLYDSSFIRLVIFPFTTLLLWYIATIATLDVAREGGSVIITKHQHTFEGSSNYSRNLPSRQAASLSATLRRHSRLHSGLHVVGHFN